MTWWTNPVGCLYQHLVKVLQRNIALRKANCPMQRFRFRTLLMYLSSQPGYVLSQYSLYFYRAFVKMLSKARISSTTGSCATVQRSIPQSRLPSQHLRSALAINFSLYAFHNQLSELDTSCVRYAANAYAYVALMCWPGCLFVTGRSSSWQLTDV